MSSECGPGGGRPGFVLKAQSDPRWGPVKWSSTKAIGSSRFEMLCRTCRPDTLILTSGAELVHLSESANTGGMLNVNHIC